MAADLAIIVPVLRRPHRVAPLLKSIDAHTPEDHRVVFVCSDGDTAEIDAVDAAGADLIVVADRRRGDYAVKVNTAYRATVEPLLFLAADDLAFHAGWFERAATLIQGRVQVVGTNDLGNPRVMAGQHSTHSLVTRRYADELGTIDGPGALLYEGYEHEFVDDEFVGTAKHRRAWAFAHDSIVEHLHPNWGKAPTDPLYDAQARRMRASRRVFQGRRRLWM